MITSWDIYWITRLDGIGVSVAILGLVLLTPTFWFLFSALCNSGIYERKTSRDLKMAKKTSPLLVLSFIFLMSVAFIPSTKEAVAIYALPKVLNNEKVQALPDNALDFINGKLKAWTEETLGGEE